MRFQALPGFRDFHPEEMALRRHLETAWHAASRAAGFEEWDGPVLEALELFTAKSGDEIAGQLYAFEDKGGRAVALRPEMTPTLARMAGARAGGLPKPIKWYCVPQFFRYEKPQRGRGREFFQWNLDVIGAAEPSADAEAIAVAVDGLCRLGLGAGDVVVRLNDRRFLARTLEALEVGEAQEPAVLLGIDKLERDPEAPARLEQLLGRARAAQILRACERFPLESAGELAPVLEACRDFGLAGFVEPDFRVVRGLAYYTGPVWEIFDRARALRAVAGGGRYDRLIGSLGGPDLPALGFGMGDMVLGELLREKKLLPDRPPRIDVYVIPIGDEMCGPARQVLRHLRDRDVRADAPYQAAGGARLGKALRTADQAGARRAILVGPDEWASRSVRVKDMATREERVVRLDELD
jgi:histidyl-tRNA synthetase